MGLVAGHTFPNSRIFNLELLNRMIFYRMQAEGFTIRLDGPIPGKGMINHGRGIGFGSEFGHPFFDVGERMIVSPGLYLGAEYPEIRGGITS